MDSMNITPELYIPAQTGIAFYAATPCDTFVEGESLVEAVKHEALAFDHQKKK